MAPGRPPFAYREHSSPSQAGYLACPSLFAPLILSREMGFTDEFARPYGPSSSSAATGSSPDSCRPWPLPSSIGSLHRDSAADERWPGGAPNDLVRRVVEEHLEEAPVPVAPEHGQVGQPHALADESADVPLDDLGFGSQTRRSHASGELREALAAPLCQRGTNLGGLDHQKLVGGGVQCAIDDVEPVEDRPICLAILAFRCFRPTGLAWRPHR